MSAPVPWSEDRWVIVVTNHVGDDVVLGPFTDKAMAESYRDMVWLEDFWDAQVKEVLAPSPARLARAFGRKP